MVEEEDEGGPKMESGVRGGLQTAAQTAAMVKAQEKKKKAEMAKYQDPAAAGSGSQETIYRDASGRIINVAMKRAEARRAEEEKRKKEAEEREATLGETTIGELLSRPRETTFSFEGGRRIEPIREPGLGVVGVIVREQRPVRGAVEASAVEVAEGLFRLTVRVACRSAMDGSTEMGRDAALLRSLVATHSVLTVRDGAFVSLLDPPEAWREAAADCRSIGGWPAMVGEEGATDTILASPIILYDYPKLAPESLGDLFDGTEIDEILSLRIMTLTEDEKACMAAIDDRAGALLARTESMAREQLMGLHGAVRGAGNAPGEADRG